MARNIERTTLLSRDIANGIKYFAFNNISEFYRRYAKQLEMSSATFHRVLSGEYATCEHVSNVEFLARQLRIMDPRGGGSTVAIKAKALVLLVEKIDKLFESFTAGSLEDLSKFMKDHRSLLI